MLQSIAIFTINVFLVYLNRKYELRIRLPPPKV